METPRDATRHPRHAKPPQVVQEKAKLTTDLQRLRKHYLSYEPTLKDLQKKYEVAMKEKMCVSVSATFTVLRLREHGFPSTRLASESERGPRTRRGDGVGA